MFRHPSRAHATECRQLISGVLYTAGNVVAAAERNVTSVGGGGQRRRVRRSVSVERNVETLIVVDPPMMDFYKNEDIENYVLTIMNMVVDTHHSLHHPTSLSTASY